MADEKQMDPRQRGTLRPEGERGREEEEAVEKRSRRWKGKKIVVENSEFVEAVSSNGRKKRGREN